MKLFLWLAIYCVLVQGQLNRVRNDSCLKRNYYYHESECYGPRRVFYAFHRVLLDCIQVTTKCLRMYTTNEYVSLEACQSDCYYHMRAPVVPKDSGKASIGGNATIDGKKSINKPPPVDNKPDSKPDSKP